MMDIERAFMSRSNGPNRHMPIWNELPPTQAGIAAALRRAFEAPCDETQRQLEELLRDLA